MEAKLGLAQGPRYVVSFILALLLLDAAMNSDQGGRTPPARAAARRTIALRTSTTTPSACDAQRTGRADQGPTLA